MDDGGLFAESDLVLLRDAELRFLVSVDFLLSLVELGVCEFTGEDAVLSLVLVVDTGPWYPGCVQFGRLFEFVAWVSPAYNCHVDGATEERELVCVCVASGAVMITCEWRCCLIGNTRTSSPRKRLSSSASFARRMTWISFGLTL